MRSLLCCLLTATFVTADPGDDLLKRLMIPEAPVLSPADAQKAFKIAPGYRIELVAAEPLIHEPVAMRFDPDGRLWVCEMSGYMPNVDGIGERDPVGCVSVLEDTDGDGKYDKRTVFLDQLVLPRAIAFAGDGVLIAEGSKLWFCRSTKNDLKCDEKTAVCDYAGAGNPEHQPNGLLWGLDNWLYSANYSLRWRKTAKGWMKEPTTSRGQWGITQDDAGRLHYNSNSSLLRGDYAPCYSPTAHLAGASNSGSMAKSGDVFPIRVTPGINRYYMLRPEGTLKAVTAACGPCIYRGDNFPADARGNAFICEPAANLVKRNIFTTDKGQRTSNFAYDKAEFLASTDERFRPVNIYDGPDGNLYIVDLYRGILQHRGYMTPYLKKQVLERGLDKPIGTGRIWRVVHETSTARKTPNLSKTTTSDRIALLSHTNAWHRETAQRLVIDSGDASAVAQLEKVLTSGESPLGRLHALWTLEGMEKLDMETAMAATGDRDPSVRASAVAICRRYLKTPPDPDLVNALAALRNDTDRDVRRELAQTLGTVTHPKADAALEPIFRAAMSDPSLRDALIGGFTGRESELLSVRLGSPTWKLAEPWRESFLRTVAIQVSKQRNPLSLLRMMHVVAEQPADAAWRQVALLEGLPTPVNKTMKEPTRPLRLPAVPEGLEALMKSNNPKVRPAAEALAKQLEWPGKDGKPIPELPALLPKHRELYETGKLVYAQVCAACHHPAGYGEGGKGPALIDSDWVRGSEERLVRMVLHGMRGPITINKEAFNKDGALEMPGMAMTLDDVKIAGALTYARREFADGATPVEMETVRRIREATKTRTEQWTQPDLQKIK